MKSRLLLFIFLFCCIINACKNKPNTGSVSKDTLTKKEKELPPAPSFASSDVDTNFVPSKSYHDNLKIQNSAGCEFYTEKNYQGYKYVLTQSGDYPVAGIKIKSVKLLPGYQVSFDFQSGCNSIENGNFQYLHQSTPDIYSSFGCDEDFSNVTTVYLKEEAQDHHIMVFPKPELMGEWKLIYAPKDAKTLYTYRFKDIGFSVYSLQVPQGLLVNLFSDKGFRNLEAQINTANGPMTYYYMIGHSRLDFVGINSISVSKLQ
jgi:hypothetical protein